MGGVPRTIVGVLRVGVPDGRQLAAVDDLSRNLISVEMMEPTAAVVRLQVGGRARLAYSTHRNLGGYGVLNCDNLEGALQLCHQQLGRLLVYQWPNYG